jgi:imidazolonepropionase-like amidohydrolase
MFIRALLSSALLTSLCLQGQQSPVAFVDVTLVPMDRDRLLPHQTVIAKDGRIIAIGPAITIRVPRAAQRIDGRGKFLMPGLADMHVHLNVRGPDGVLKNEDYATLFLANGITTVRCMWGNSDILTFRRSIEQGSVIGPQIYTAGPLTDGSPPIWPRSRVVETASQAIDAVTSDKREGYDAVKVYNRLLPEVYAALVSTARTQGLPVWGHVPERVGVERVLEARQDSIEHIGGYLEALRRDESPDKVADLVSATRRAGTWNCATLVFFQGAVPADEAALLLARPAMRFLPAALLSGWKNNPQLASLTPNQFGRLRLDNEKRNRFVRALHEGGAKILLGTDTPNPFVVPGFAIHDELRNLVNVGFTPYEAIKAGTSDAAEFLKSQNQWGTVAVGLRADLILLEANPLQDVSNVNRRVGVMVHGHWMLESELKGRLERLAASYTLSGQAP